MSHVFNSKRLASLTVAVLMGIAASFVAMPRASAQQDPLAAAEAYREKLFDRIAPSVIFISRGDAFGSGFFVNADGLALTNHHVVGDAKKVTVVLRDGRKFTAKVVELAHNHVDLALIQVPVHGVHPLQLTGFEDLRVGSWVGSIGHGSGAIWTFTDGMVSNIYPSKSSRPVFQTQIPLNPGSSGGPVFDRRGRVVGIVTAGITSSNNVNFAIRSDVALTSLDRLAKNCRCLTVTAPKGVPIFVDGSMVGTGPRVMLAVSKGKHAVFAVIKGKMDKKHITYPRQKHVTLK